MCIVTPDLHLLTVPTMDLCAGDLHVCMFFHGFIFLAWARGGGRCGSGPIMAKRNQQGRENVCTSVLSAVKALDLYAQFHTDCIKPQNGDTNTKVLAK